MNFYSVVRYLDKMIPINVEQKRFTHICYKLDMLQYIVKGNKNNSRLCVTGKYRQNLKCLYIF